MFSYGYLREATKAHIDLDEEEIKSMKIEERLYIWANDAMVKICGGKPKYEYFKCKVVKEYQQLVNDMNTIRPATDLELEVKKIADSLTFPNEDYQTREEFWTMYETPEGDFPFNMGEPQWADATEHEAYWSEKHVYLTNHQIRMPRDFIAFANKQCWAWVKPEVAFDPEQYIMGRTERLNNQPVKTKIYANKDFAYSSRNSIVFEREGVYLIPYRGLWYIFRSDEDVKTENIDMPFDIFACIPLYCAAMALQIDYAQKSQIKMAEFMGALANITTTDFLSLNEVMPSF